MTKQGLNLNPNTYHKIQKQEHEACKIENANKFFFQ
jgi:hypothetical protein